MKPKMQSAIEKITLTEATFTGVVSYMNDSATIVSDGLNYVEDGTDAEQYKVVFRLIFDSMRQEQHYKMMMGIEE